MELLSFSVREVARFDIITYSHVRGSSWEVCLCSYSSMSALNHRSSPPLVALTSRNQSSRLRPLRWRFHKRPSPPQHPPRPILLPKSRNSSRPILLVRRYRNNSPRRLHHRQYLDRATFRIWNCRLLSERFRGVEE